MDVTDEAARRLARVEELFAAAKSLPAAARAELLARGCGSDAALRREVEQLLALDAGGMTWLDASADAWFARRIGR